MVRSTLVAAQVQTGAMNLTWEEVKGNVLFPTTSIVVHPDSEKRKVTREGSGSEGPVTVIMSAPLVDRALDGEVVKMNLRGMKGRIAVDNEGVEPNLDVDP